MQVYKLTGDAARIRQVIDHFSLRIEEEHSGSHVDVQVPESEADDVEEFAESVGVDYEEIE